MRNFINEPLHLVQRLVFISLIFAFVSCTTSGKGGAGQGNQIIEDILKTESGTIVFHNKTYFTVHLVRGSGRTDVATINPGASVNVSNIYKDAEDYYPEFIIPLTSSFSLPKTRPLDRDFYYRIDNKKSYQEVEILTPSGFNDSSTYIIFTNNGNSGGVSLSPNVSASWMPGINFPDLTKSNINQNETVVYRVNHSDLQSLRINPLNIRFGEMKYQPSYVYSFSFDGSTATLTDARPLHRVGEPAWVKTIPEASTVMPLAAADGEIHLFAQSDNGFTRYSYDSAGNAKAPVRNNESIEITAVIKTSDGFFITGHDENLRPIARMQGANGQTLRTIEPSSRTEYRLGYFLAVAQKEGTFLAVGAADRNDYNENFPAYARQVRDNGAALIADWELGRADFNDALKNNAKTNIECGEIRSAVCDSERKRWLLTGKNIEFDSEKKPVTSSYIAVISDDGIIEKIDTSFRNLRFNKLLLDSAGNYYAIGEEQKGNETRAIIIKYNTDGKQIWRSSVQPANHSYYQDAILDAENNQIVLAGTVGAKDNSGSGGIPLVEAVGLEKGETLWSEKLNDKALAGTSLAAFIVPAPDYGFALTLLGIANDDYAKPFMIIRVNARGKLYK